MPSAVLNFPLNGLYLIWLLSVFVYSPHISTHTLRYTCDKSALMRAKYWPRTRNVNFMNCLLRSTCTKCQMHLSTCAVIYWQQNGNQSRALLRRLIACWAAHAFTAGAKVTVHYPKKHKTNEDDEQKKKARAPRISSLYSVFIITLERQLITVFARFITSRQCTTVHVSPLLSPPSTFIIVLTVVPILVMSSSSFWFIFFSRQNSSRQKRIMWWNGRVVAGKHREQK